ncbi:hypothetical protein NCS52_01122300 [Fusarium sp. LHS14.1]|nr:hypothetical protein NCS52_01122300 [Fusarium sp. LHS14.1]
MPNEVLFRIAEMFPEFKDKYILVFISGHLHQTFDKHLYQASGKSLSWLPVYLAARERDFAQLNKCKKYGAPADIYWESDHDEKACLNPSIEQGVSPLDEAVMDQHIGLVKWFLAIGASGNNQKGRCSTLLRAFWMWRKNTIASLPTNQRRTHRNSYLDFAREKLRVRADKAKRIVDLLLAADADVSFNDAAWLDPILAKKLYGYGVKLENPDLPRALRGDGWAKSFDPNSVVMSDWLAMAQAMGFARG